MPDFATVSLREAKGQGKYVQEYIAYIEQIPPGAAGKLHLGEDEDPVAIRRRLILAAQALDVRLGIKRSGLDLYFWLESPMPPAAAEEPRGRRGRPPKRRADAPTREQPVSDELDEEEAADNPELLVSRDQNRGNEP